MDIKASIDAADAASCASALKSFLESYLNPAFGALPKAEVELLVLQMLEKLRLINGNLGAYELVSKLKITNTKARRLLYERDLRRTTPEDLDKQLLIVLQKPIILKDGELLFVLQIENSLLRDHLREKVKLLGHVTDGSFSPGIVKLSLDAMAALIDEMYQGKDEKKETARKALIAAGAPDTTFKGVIRAVLKRVGSKIAAEAGEALMDEASGYLVPIVTGASDRIAKTFKGFFADAGHKKGNKKTDA
jgi:hypothetical protein